MEIYTEGVANGDPIVVVADGEAVTLGTGFESIKNVQQEVSYVSRTGNATTLIPQHAADRLEGSEKIDIFTIAASFETDDRE